MRLTSWVVGLCLSFRACEAFACPKPRRRLQIRVGHKPEKEVGKKPNQPAVRKIIDTDKRLGVIRRAIVQVGKGGKLRRRVSGGGPRVKTRLIKAAAKATDGKDVRALLKKARALRSPMTTKEYTILVNAAGRVGDWEGAIDWLGIMKKKGRNPNVFSYSAAIAACGRAGIQEQALDLLEEMTLNGVAPNAYTYSSAIAACTDKEKALALLEEMPSKGVKRDVYSYSIAIKACEKEGDWGKAVGLLSEMDAEGVEPNVVSFSAAISACARKAQDTNLQEQQGMPLPVAAEDAPQFGIALGLLEEMKRRGEHPNCYTYSPAIAACGLVGDWRTGLDLLEEAHKALDGKLDATVYNAAITTCGLGGNWEAALSLLDTMEHRGVQVDMISFNLAIIACGRAGRCQEVLALIERAWATGAKPDSKSYGAAIAACEKANRHREGLALIKEMEEKGIATNTIMYTNVMSSCLRAGALELVLSLLSDMVNRGPPPSTVSYTMAISACGGGQGWERAIELIDEMRAAGVPRDEVTYESALKACDRSSQWNCVLDVLDTMRADNLQPTQACYMMALGACSQLNLWQYALHLLHEAEDRGLADNVRLYSLAIGALRFAGRFEEAKGVLRRMQGRARSGQVQGPDERCYLEVICAAELIGEVKEADLLWDEMVAGLNAEGTEPELSSYNRVLLLLSQNKLHERTHVMFDRLRESKVLPSEVSYTCLMATSAEGGLWQEALSLLEDMERAGLQPNVASYTNAIAACNKAGRPEVALQVLESMSEVGVAPNRVTYNTVLTALEREGDSLKALEIFEGMIRDGLEPDPVTYNCMIEVLSHSNETVVRCDDIFTHGVCRGVLRPWVDGEGDDPTWKMLDFHGFSTSMARAAVRTALSAMSKEWRVRSTWRKQGQGNNNSLITQGNAADPGGQISSEIDRDLAAQVSHCEGIVANVDRSLQAHAGEGLQEQEHVHNPMLDLVIITGTGEGRQEGPKGRIKPAVMHLLTCEMNPPVACREHKHNPGRLIVPAVELQMFAVKQASAAREQLSVITHNHGEPTP